MEFIGKRLREARTIRNRTQVDIAKKLGVTKQMICQYESNIVKPSDKTIYKIADYLDFPIGYFSNEALDKVRCDNIIFDLY